MERIPSNPYKEEKIMEKTRLGCAITRDFLMSTDGEDTTLFYDLMDKGFKELYYTAPYHWGLLNKEKKRIITYTEGDIAKIDCETERMLIDEAESHVDFIKKDYSDSPSVWKEGELLVKKLRGNDD